MIQYLDFHSDHELHDSYRCAIIIITKVGLSDLSVFCESISLLLTVDDFWNAWYPSVQLYGICVILSNSLWNFIMFQSN